MINNVKITSSNGSITVDLLNPYETGFIITGIDGLSPEKANINTTDLSGSDGSVFNSARLQDKNISIGVTLSDRYMTIEEARLNLYKYFPIKGKVRLDFETDNRKVYIEGYVESNSVNIFSQLESSTISIICPYPYFRLVDPKVIESKHINPEFAFPFYVNSGNNIEVSSVRSSYGGSLTNDSNREAGFIFEMECLSTQSLTDVTIYHAEENVLFTIPMTTIQTLTGGSMAQGDILTLNTNIGQKSLTMKKGATTYNLLQVFTRTTVWQKLVPGYNSFYFSTTGTASSLDNFTFKLYSGLNYEGI